MTPYKKRRNHITDYSGLEDRQVRRHTVNVGRSFLVGASAGALITGLAIVFHII